MDFSSLFLFYLDHFGDEARALSAAREALLEAHKRRR